MEEYKIGDIVDIDGIKYIVKEEIEEGCCIGCAFYDQKTECKMCREDGVFSICNIIDCIFAKFEENKTKEESLDLTKILDGCPVGTKFYSVIFGEIEFSHITSNMVFFTCDDGCNLPVFKDGLHFNNYKGECTVFEAKDQRDWSKFIRFWDNPKKERFDPKTLQPFDRVLARYNDSCKWKALFFSHCFRSEKDNVNLYVCGCAEHTHCIPFNEETEHLVGTTEDAPEYYRYWED